MNKLDNELKDWFNMTDIEKLRFANEELNAKIKKQSDFNYDITCKLVKLKTRIGLNIQGPLKCLINRNDKLKPEYKLDFIDKELILNILKEIDELYIEIKTKEDYR